MTSHKKRRSINVDIAYLDGLKTMAQRQGIKTGTALASMIFAGAAPPLPTLLKRGEGRGVSMTEAMWLTLRHRAASVERSTRRVTELLLTGRLPSLTPEEISYGEEAAQAREERRAKGEIVGESPPKKKKPRAPRKPKKETVAKPEIPEKLADTPRPDPVEDAEEAERRKQYKSSLSKGEPAAPGNDQGESQNPQKRNPDFYGGIFTF